MAIRTFKVRTGLTVAGPITTNGVEVSTFDSDNVLNILIDNGIKGITDSDYQAIADIRNDVDSDSAKIQQIQTDHDAEISALSARLDSDEVAISALEARVTVVETSADSDVTTIHRLKAEADSDAAVIQIVRQEAESDALAIAALNAEFESTIASVSARLDSDELIIQSTRSIVLGKLDSDSAVIQQLRTDIDAEIIATDANVAALTARLDSDSAKIQQIQSDLEAEIIATDADVATLTARLDSDETQLQAIQTDLETAESNIVTINSNITDINTKLDSDEARLEAIDARVDLLEAAVDDTGFDSDQIVAIITENTNPDIVSRLDSDTIAIQNLGTRIDNLGGSQSINVTAYTFTSPANDSDFSGLDNNGRTLAYVANKIHVYLNGILLSNNTDYTAVDGSTVTLTSAPDSDDVLTVVKYLGTVQAGFDSEQVVSIITENTNPDTVARLDSDEIKIQQIQTDLNALDVNVTARLDSDSAKIQQIQTDLETEINTTDVEITAITARLDSDSAKIQQIQTDLDAEISATNADVSALTARLDSDSTKIQQIQSDLDTLDTTKIAALRADADSDTIVIQAIRTSVDSDYALFNAKIELFNGLTDSDLTVVSNLRNDLSAVELEILGLNSSLTARLDSDSTRIQEHDTRIGVLETSNTDVIARLDSDTTAIQLLNTQLIGLSGSAAIQTKVYTYTATQGQTAFTGADANGQTLAYAPGYIYVFVNGVLVIDTTDYVATDGSTVTINSALDAGNTVQVIKHVGTVQSGFDSEGIVNIINENVTTDPTVNTRLDSDSAKIQAIQTEVSALDAALTARLDSDSAKIQQIQSDLDTEIAATNADVSALTARLDSDSTAIQQLQTDMDVLDAALTARLDSDSAVIQQLQTDLDVEIAATNADVDALTARLDSDSIAIQQIETDLNIVESNISATNTDTSGESQQVLDSFATSDFRTIKYTVSASSNDGSYFASEILLIHDGTNVNMVEYATISTHDSEFVFFDADINAGNVRLLGTPTNSLTNVKTVRQTIA